MQAAAATLPHHLSRPTRQPRKSGRALQTERRRYLSAHPLCRRCETKGLIRAAQEIDHIVPLALLGPDTEENKQGLCRPCHRIKTAEDFKKISHENDGCDKSGTPLDPDHHWNRT